MTTTGRAHKAIASAQAPKAVGPYSQALAAGDLVFCSGQIPLDPATGALVEGGFRAEAERVLLNLEAVLRAAGLDWGDVVRTTVYLTDLADFPVLNEIYALRFAEPFPARVTVGVAALPKGARIEMDAIALRRSGGSQAVRQP
jgi:2-iminobutanoate/2-iminopropanoate deaminase